MPRTQEQLTEDIYIDLTTNAHEAQRITPGLSLSEFATSCYPREQLLQVIAWAKANDKPIPAWLENAPQQP